MGRRLLTISAVAKRIGQPPGWVSSHYRELQEQNGFPAPVEITGLSKHPRWDSEAVDRWFHNTLDPQMAPELRNRDLKEAWSRYLVMNLEDATSRAIRPLR